MFKVANLDYKPEFVSDEGKRALINAVNQITRHPETYDQQSWHSNCGTSHCLFGWAQVQAGLKEDGDAALDDGKKIFDFSTDLAIYMSSSIRTFEEIHNATKLILTNVLDRNGLLIINEIGNNLPELEDLPE